MNNTVTIADFTGELSLPIQADDDLTYLNELIANQQEYYLIKLLGNFLYEEFNTAIVSGTTEDKWINLLNGAEFTAHDINQKEITLQWAGVANMIKYLIYYEYIRDTQQTSTQVGTKSINISTGNIISANIKLCRIYNKGLELYGNEIIEFNESPQVGKIYSKLVNIRNVNYKQYYNILYNSLIKPSAFNFIYSNSSEYENWYFKQLGNINALNI